mmetsp:Transcript_5520/g.9622  ORF Transcript_5520/g.9622 Transcript_5520/m.9622 type:complete len:128 (-) Transcript_5520:1111-1494(-)
MTSARMGAGSSELLELGRLSFGAHCWDAENGLKTPATHAWSPLALSVLDGPNEMSLTNSAGMVAPVGIGAEGACACCRRRGPRQRCEGCASCFGTKAPRQLFMGKVSHFGTRVPRHEAGGLGRAQLG